MSFPGIPLLLLAGCTPLGVWLYEEPRVTGSTVELQADTVAHGDDGRRANVVIHVRNPNAFDLATSRIEVAVELDGRRVEALALDTAITLRRNRSTRLVVPFSSGGDGAARVAGALDRPGPRLDLAGRLELETPIGRRRVRFASRVPYRD